MSIGKSSIARAVNATAKTPASPNTNPITKLNIQNIGILSIAKIPDNIESLKASIKKRGILSPVLVSVTPKGDIWLIDGYSRLFAAKELNITEINAAVINVENKSEANRIYAEFLKLKPKPEPNNNTTQEKFDIPHIKDRDLPTYLL